jgi:hypothetical protein
MREDGATSKVFLTFLHWARALSERSQDDDMTGVTVGMRLLPRHGTCFGSNPIEVEHEASVHEL